SGHRQGDLDGFISNSCSSDGECDDGDPCTDDLCGTDQTCTNGPKDCSSVVDDCNAATCDKATGECSGVPKREGRSCMDFLGNPGTCMQGVCQPVPQCAAGPDFLDCTTSFNHSSGDTSASVNTFDTYKCATGETGPEYGYQ